MKGLVWAVCLFGVGGLAQLAATSARPRPKQDLPAAGGLVRTYYIAAEETEWDYAPLGIDMTTGKGSLSKERRWRIPSRDQITSGTSIARRSTGSIPTVRSQHGSRAPRRTNTSVCWDRSCARRSAIRSRSFSRTTPRGPTACIRMESSTRRPRRGPCTPTMFPTSKRPGPWCRRGRRSLTSGRCRNGRGRARRSQLDRLGVPLARQRIQRRGFRPGGAHHRGPARPD